MLLAIDIGNSNITFGLFKGRKLAKRLSFPTPDAIGKKKGFAGALKKSFSRCRIEKIAICSVVPKAEKPLSAMVRRIFNIKPLIMGKDIRVPIRNLYKKPKQVGQDRLVSAYGGRELYKPPVIIIDFGTAVTFDVVSKTGAYLGGIIVPGVQLALTALSEQAALLPRITLKETRYMLGRTTAESMANGIFYGYGAMCDGLVRRLKKRFGLRFTVVATGGNARLIRRYSSSIQKIDDDLVLKGISLIFAKNKKNT